jgi:hypothetical protein
MEAGLKVNKEKTKYIFMSSHNTLGQNQYVQVANKSSENVENFSILTWDWP